MPVEVEERDGKVWLTVTQRGGRARGRVEWRVRVGGYVLDGAPLLIAWRRGELSEALRLVALCDRWGLDDSYVEGLLWRGVREGWGRAEREAREAIERRPRGRPRAYLVPPEPDDPTGPHYVALATSLEVYHVAVAHEKGCPHAGGGLPEQLRGLPPYVYRPPYLTLDTYMVSCRLLDDLLGRVEDYFRAAKSIGLLNRAGLVGPAERAHLALRDGRLEEVERLAATYRGEVEVYVAAAELVRLLRRSALKLEDGVLFSCPPSFDLVAVARGGRAVYVGNMAGWRDAEDLSAMLRRGRIEPPPGDLMSEADEDDRRKVRAALLDEGKRILREHPWLLFVL